MTTMSYKIIFDRHPQFLRVTVTGDNSEEWLLSLVEGPEEQEIFQGDDAPRGD